MRRNLIKHTLLLISYLGLGLFVGCSSDVQDRSDLASTASFDSLEIQASNIDSVTSIDGGQWSEIPLSKTVTFQNCLNDQTLQVSLQAQDIEITTPFGVYTKRTNSRGCFTWDENFKFNFFKKERLIAHPIKIKGINGGHIGLKKIDLYINPWANNLTEVAFDSRFDELPEQITLSNEKIDRDDFSVITLNNIRASYFNSGYNNEQGTAFYEFRVTAGAEGRRYDLKGNQKLLSLQNGHLQLTIDLIEERGGTYKKLGISHNEVSMRNGVIQEKAIFHIGEGFQNHPDSRYFLIFKSTPVGLPIEVLAPMKANQVGVLPMPGLTSNAEGTLEEASNYPIEMMESQLKSELIVNALKDDNNIAPVPLATNDNFGVQIARVNLGNGVLLPGPHTATTARERRMPVEICLVDGLSQNGNSPLVQTRVELIAFQKGIRDSEEVRHAVTNPNGCFQSFIVLTYDYLACEQYYELDYKIRILEGRYVDLEKVAKVAVNPFNKGDLYYDLNQVTEAPQVDCRAPQLSVGNFTYRNEGIPRDGFKVNRHLHLSLNKRYSFSFQPQFFRAGTFQEVENHSNLYQGELLVEAEIYAPKNSEVDYFNFYEEDWDFITATKGTYRVNGQGKVLGDLIIPFHLSETLYLSYKNLMRITVRPKGELNLKPLSFVIPFYATAPGATLNTAIVEDALSESLRQRVTAQLELGMKIPGFHQELGHSNETLLKKPIDLFREELLNIGKKESESFRVITGDRDLLNKIPPVGLTSWDQVTDEMRTNYKKDFSMEDFRTLSTKFGDVPKKTLKRFCRLFYPLPMTNQRKTIMIGDKSEEIGGEHFQECFNNPGGYLELTPMSFVDDLLRTDKHTFDGLNYEYSSARFIKDEMGKINRGNAFFAAFGDRSSVSWGERESDATERSISYGLMGMSSVFMGLQQGHTRTEEVFKVSNRTLMRAAFDRNYSSRDVIKLDYNSLNLRFTARVVDCITLRSKKSIPLSYSFCRNDAKTKSVAEKWFLISDNSAGNNGMISDGNVMGDNNRQQVIRGQQNFNFLWSDLKADDTVLVVREIGTISVGDAFEKYIHKEENLLPFESKFDRSFPGMLVPFSHTPITSCTDCQDP